MYAIGKHTHWLSASHIAGAAYAVGTTEQLGLCTGQTTNALSSCTSQIKSNIVRCSIAEVFNAQE